MRVEVNASVIAYRGRPANLTILRDVTERKRAEEKLRHLSMHDQMTGLYNRAYFDDALGRLNVPRQMPLSVIMGDVNGLKLVNDVFGHNMGDKLLRHIARVLQEYCRGEDIAARVGGDEFGVILPQTPGDAARQLIRHINDRCSEAVMGRVNVSISFGSATQDADHVSGDIHEMLKRAEDRMYRNKMLEMDSVRSAVISSLVNALTEKSQENGGHAERLDMLAIAVGREMDLDDNYLADLTLLARLHDLGKVDLPDEILMKERPLTEEEWVEIRRQPEAGFRSAQASLEMASVARAILTHHRRAIRWKGLSPGDQGRGDSPHCPDHRRGGCLRRHDQRQAAPASGPSSGRPGGNPEVFRPTVDPEVVRVFVRIFAKGPPWCNDAL